MILCLHPSIITLSVTEGKYLTTVSMPVLVHGRLDNSVLTVMDAGSAQKLTLHLHFNSWSCLRADLPAMW